MSLDALSSIIATSPSRADNERQVDLLYSDILKNDGSRHYLRHERRNIIHETTLYVNELR